MSHSGGPSCRGRAGGVACIYNLKISNLYSLIYNSLTQIQTDDIEATLKGLRFMFVRNPKNSQLLLSGAWFNKSLYSGKQASEHPFLYSRKFIFSINNTNNNMMERIDFRIRTTTTGQQVDETRRVHLYYDRILDLYQSNIK